MSKTATEKVQLLSTWIERQRDAYDGAKKRMSETLAKGFIADSFVFEGLITAQEFVIVAEQTDADLLALSTTDQTPEEVIARIGMFALNGIRSGGSSSSSVTNQQKAARVSAWIEVTGLIFG